MRCFLKLGQTRCQRQFASVSCNGHTSNTGTYEPGMELPRPVLRRCDELLGGSVHGGIRVPNEVRGRCHRMLCHPFERHISNDGQRGPIRTALRLRSPSKRLRDNLWTYPWSIGVGAPPTLVREEIWAETHVWC